jgi:hypothetical protein
MPPPLDIGVIDLASIEVSPSQSMEEAMLPSKAGEKDLIGRFREVISDPLNLPIERVPIAGVVRDNEVFLHNGNRVPTVGDDAYYGGFRVIAR